MCQLLFHAALYTLCAIPTTLVASFNKVTCCIAQVACSQVCYRFADQLLHCRCGTACMCSSGCLRWSGQSSWRSITWPAPSAWGTWMVTGRGDRSSLMAYASAWPYLQVRIVGCCPPLYVGRVCMLCIHFLALFQSTVLSELPDCIQVSSLASIC